MCSSCFSLSGDFKIRKLRYMEKEKYFSSGRCLLITAIYRKCTIWSMRKAATHITYIIRSVYLSSVVVGIADICHQFKKLCKIMLCLLW